MLEVCGGDYAGVRSHTYFQAHVVAFINLDLGIDLVWVPVKGVK